MVPLPPADTVTGLEYSSAHILTSPTLLLRLIDMDVVSLCVNQRSNGVHITVGERAASGSVQLQQENFTSQLSVWEYSKMGLVLAIKGMVTQNNSRDKLVPAGRSMAAPIWWSPTTANPGCQNLDPVWLFLHHLRLSSPLAGGYCRQRHVNVLS